MLATEPLPRRRREWGNSLCASQLKPLDANGHLVVVSDAAPTDMALRDRALRGDEQAFVIVYDRYAHVC